MRNCLLRSCTSIERISYCFSCPRTARSLIRSSGVWKLARLATHNRYFVSLDEVLIAVAIMFRSVVKTKPCAAHEATTSSGFRTMHKNSGSISSRSKTGIHLHIRGSFKAHNGCDPKSSSSIWQISSWHCLEKLRVTQPCGSGMGSDQPDPKWAHRQS